MDNSTKVRSERRLAAILAADIAGYSRLMGVDEEGTLAQLKAHRNALIDPTIVEYHGRIVKTTGDGMLVEFASVVDAMQCAVAVQRGMAARNVDVLPEGRIEFRIGINVGDIIIENGDIFGDGVNIAARLEGIALPGGICISGKVYEEVNRRLAISYDDLGAQKLKNITDPIQAYRVQSPGAPSAPSRGIVAQAKQHGRTLWLVSAAVLVLLGVGATWWNIRPIQTGGQTLAPVQPDPKATSSAKPLPRLAIVVLPFINLSDDKQQDYFADGITEDLTTDLSRIPGSFVIARNTAFTFKGRSVDVRQVGSELGVRYVLEGSVRKAGNQIRVSVQLNDATTGGQLMAERMDVDQANLSQLTGDSGITERLAATLGVALVNAEGLREQRERPGDPDAIGLTLYGMSILNEQHTRESIEKASGVFEEALRKEPSYTEARIGLANCLTIILFSRWTSEYDVLLRRAEALAAQVVASAPKNPRAHFVKAQVLRLEKQFDAAIAEYASAILFDANYASAHAWMGYTMILAGRAAEGIPLAETAIRLSPRDPSLYYWYFQICHAHNHLAAWEQAIVWCRKSAATGSLWITQIDLIAAYGSLGRNDESRSAITELHRLMPGYTVQDWAKRGPTISEVPAYAVEYERIVEALRKGGLAEN